MHTSCYFCLDFLHVTNHKLDLKVTINCRLIELGQGCKCKERKLSCLSIIRPSQGSSTQPGRPLHHNNATFISAHVRCLQYITKIKVFLFKTV